MERERRSNHRWVWIGCGGCLSVAILAILLVVAIGSLGFYRVKTIQDRMQTWERQKREINQIYPFTPPHDHRIDEERYRAFLSIRESMLVLAEKRLDWLFEFIAQKENPGGRSPIKTGFQFIQFFSHLSEVGVELIALLTEERMSLKEYTYLTQLTMRALYDWSERETPANRKAAGDRYMKPILDLSDKIEQIEKEEAGERIHLGPLDQQKILNRIQTFPQPPNEVGDMIFVHCDQITESMAGVFVDVFIVD